MINKLRLASTIYKHERDAGRCARWWLTDDGFSDVEWQLSIVEGALYMYTVASLAYHTNGISSIPPILMKCWWFWHQATFYPGIARKWSNLTRLEVIGLSGWQLGLFASGRWLVFPAWISHSATRNRWISKFSVEVCSVIPGVYHWLFSCGNMRREPWHQIALLIDRFWENQFIL